MDIDLGTDDDEPRDFASLPAGTYLVRVAEVAPGRTRNGDERWGMRLVVAEGEFVGRHAAWDGVVFSQRGLPRARRVLAALGLPSSGRVQLSPDDLIGKEAFATIAPRESRDPNANVVIRRNEVAYDGYRAVEDGAPASTNGNGRHGSDDGDGEAVDLPF